MTSPQHNQEAERLYSTYAGDPAMRELVGLFVTELPARVRSLTFALDRGALEDLARLAHQLKGAGAGYGFAPITDAAARLEQATNSLAQGEAELTQIKEELDALIDICKRAAA